MLAACLFVPTLAHAQLTVVPRSSGLRLSSSIGLILGQKNLEPLAHRGWNRAVEALYSHHFGTSYAFEVGLRGESIDFDPTPRTPFGRPSEAASFGNELSVLAGVRADLAARPLLGGLMPVIRGGYRLGSAGGKRSAERSLVFGPHFGVGLERAFEGGLAAALEVQSHATFSPPLLVTVAVGVSVYAEIMD